MLSQALLEVSILPRCIARGKSLLYLQVTDFKLGSVTRSQPELTAVDTFDASAIRHTGQTTVCRHVDAHILVFAAVVRPRYSRVSSAVNSTWLAGAQVLPYEGVSNMPTQAPGPKARNKHVTIPLIGRVPWFREPFKVVEPVNGTFLKVFNLDFARAVFASQQQPVPLYRTSSERSCSTQPHMRTAGCLD